MLVKMYLLYQFAFVIFLITKLCSANNCVPREYTNGTVCVCNSTFCDTIPGVGNLESGTYIQFTSNKAGLRFEVTNGSSASTSDNFLSDILQYYVIINSSATYKSIIGFGGAFTDATGININSLPAAARTKLVEAYFSTDGSEYSVGRVPIGGTDFSTRWYTYADNTPGSIDSFALQEEDYVDKIPYILQANDLSNGSLLLFSSLWSPPLWMKDTGNFLKLEYYQLLADYYVKFFEAYEDNNVTFWGVTTQNEPSIGLLDIANNSMAWLPPQQITFLTENLGPSIRNSSFSDLKIIIHDDDRPQLITVPEYFANETALSYLDGVGVHWYLDSESPASLLDLAHTDKKDVFLLGTEACEGFLPTDPHVDLGSWDRGTAYASDIIDLLNYDGAGWVDWNLALDTGGGPNYINNFVDSPIIVNATAGEFYKQPMYYALAHFSKFLPRGSVRVDVSGSLLTTVTGIKSVAFRRPDGYIALVVENTNLINYDFVITDTVSCSYPVSISGNSINTIVYN